MTAGRARHKQPSFRAGCHSERAQRSRGIAIVAVEGPSTGDDRDSSTARLRAPLGMTTPLGATAVAHRALAGHVWTGSLLSSSMTRFGRLVRLPRVVASLACAAALASVASAQTTQRTAPNADSVETRALTRAKPAAVGMSNALIPRLDSVIKAGDRRPCVAGRHHRRRSARQAAVAHAGTATRTGRPARPRRPTARCTTWRRSRRSWRRRPRP